MACRDTGLDVPNRFELRYRLIQIDLVVKQVGGEIMSDAARAYAVGQHDTRPWGAWMVIDCGPGFVVKRITVRPGQRLSLQRHRHRDEQWIMVAGVARVTRDRDQFDLAAGESTRILHGQAPRIAHPGTVQA